MRLYPCPLHAQVLYGRAVYDAEEALRGHARHVVQVHIADRVEAAVERTPELMFKAVVRRRVEPVRCESPYRLPLCRGSRPPLLERRVERNVVLEQYILVVESPSQACQCAHPLQVLFRADAERVILRAAASAGKAGCNLPLHACRHRVIPLSPFPQACSCQCRHHIERVRELLALHSSSSAEQRAAYVSPVCGVVLHVRAAEDGKRLPVVTALEVRHEGVKCSLVRVGAFPRGEAVYDDALVWHRVKSLLRTSSVRTHECGGLAAKSADCHIARGIARLYASAVHPAEARAVL